MPAKERDITGSVLLIVPALFVAIALFVGWAANPAQAVPWGGMLALAVLMPVLCSWSAFLKRDRMARREDAANNTDHINQSRYYVLYSHNRLPDFASRSLPPVLIITLMNVYFSYLLVFTTRIKNWSPLGNFLLLGHLFATQCNVVAETQALNTMCFAYLGWFVWTVWTIFSRLVTMEIVEATYWSILARLIVAVFVALMFYHLASFFGLKLPEEGVGFGVGLFTDAALTTLSSQLRSALGVPKEASEDFPLEAIQGVSQYRKFRLMEMGLDNCENLAAANAVELYLKSSMKINEVADWIGQAQLLILSGSKRFAQLQQNGIRTSGDFYRGKEAPGCGVIATITGLPESQISFLATQMESSPSFINLRDLLDHLRAYPATAADRHLPVLPKTV